MKGKPWPAEDEKKLREWFKSGVTDLRALTFALEGRYSGEGVRQKLISLELLKEQQQQKNHCCCSTEIELPPELPSVEQALKKLTAALNALEKPGLDKNEISRLRSIIAGYKIYKTLLADYVDYCGTEAELKELKEKYERLVKKSPKSESK